MISDMYEEGTALGKDMVMSQCYAVASQRSCQERGQHKVAGNHVRDRSSYFPFKGSSRQPHTAKGNHVGQISLRRSRTVGLVWVAYVRIMNLGRILCQVP